MSKQQQKQQSKAKEEKTQIHLSDSDDDIESNLFASSLTFIQRNRIEKLKEEFVKLLFEWKEKNSETVNRPLNILDIKKQCFDQVGQEKDNNGKNEVLDYYIKDIKDKILGLKRLLPIEIEKTKAINTFHKLITMKKMSLSDSEKEMSEFQTDIQKKLKRCTNAEALVIYKQVTEDANKEIKKLEELEELEVKVDKLISEISEGNEKTRDALNLNLKKLLDGGFTKKEAYTEFISIYEKYISVLKRNKSESKKSKVITETPEQIKEREQNARELEEDERKEKELAGAKKKPSKTKKPSKVTKPVGGGGSASVMVQVPTVSIPKPTKGEFEIFNDEVQQFIKDLSSKKIENLNVIKGKIATIWEKLTPAQKTQLQIPNERINGRIMSLEKSKCVSDEKIVEDTMKQSGESNGKKFEAYLINKTIQTLTVEDGFKVLYDKRGIMNNESHPDLQVVATGQSYSLAEASMYDFSTPTHDIEIKFYLEFSDDEPLPIPITKFLGSAIYNPYFRVVNGKVKLYNIWCEQLKDWVNKEFDKEILFVIMTDKGLVSYNYTDELTTSMNSSGWRKTPFDIQLNSEGKVDREGNELLRVLTSSYKNKVHKFGDDDKTCFMLPVDKIKNCYIKK
jgi:hypothetical protein